MVQIHFLPIEIHMFCVPCLVPSSTGPSTLLFKVASRSYDKYIYVAYILMRWLSVLLLLHLRLIVGRWPERMTALLPCNPKWKNERKKLGPRGAFKCKLVVEVQSPLESCKEPNQRTATSASIKMGRSLVLHVACVTRIIML